MYLFIAISGLLLGACSTPTSAPGTRADFHYLALGDSYTIGASVAESERWPHQLMDMAATAQETDRSAMRIIYRAVSGWTTENLLSSLRADPPATPEAGTYQLVSLLIGVNNQYRGWSFDVYEQHVPELVDIALSYAGGDAERVIIVSIPDYSYTPYGANRRLEIRQTIENEIDRYNDWMQAYAESRGIRYVCITDITRRGLVEPDLVATDGLHPSGRAYRLMAERILDAWVDAADVHPQHEDVRSLMHNLHDR